MKLKNIEKGKEINEVRQKRYESFISNKYKNYMKNAYSRDLEFKLTKQQFSEITLQRCFYCERVPKLYTYYTFAFNFNGLDRADNNKGYISENVVSCCGFCNILKYNHNVKDFNNILKNINYEYLKLDKYIEFLKNNKYYHSISYNEYSNYIVDIINKYTEN